VFGLTSVDGIRIELVSAIMELLATCPRAMLGMLQFQPALILRLSAGEQEISSALTGMEGVGLIERVSGGSPDAQWQLRTVPTQRSSSRRSAQGAADVMTADAFLC
jgi:hypothetical protein